MQISRIDRYIMDAEGLDRLTRHEIEAVQLEKLNRVLAREKERNGFYRNLPEKLESLTELQTLPFTDEEDLAARAPDLLLCSQARIQRVLSDATSGTTGAAKRVFYTEADLEDTVRLYVAGLGELVFPGSSTLICFPFSGPFGLGELIAEAIRRLGARPLKAGPFLSYGEYADLIARESPDTFVGMPVQLLSLLRFCGPGSLRRALVSGDACPDGVILACEELLGSRLFPHYGSREMGMAGAICCRAHDGMHLRETHVIPEIIDEAGRVLPPGEFGELVITTVGMEAMPLLRYRTGDYTRILPEPCPCGSEVLRLDRIRRRDDGMAVLDDRVFRHPAVVDWKAEMHEGELVLSVLTQNDKECRELEVLGRIHCRRACQEDRPMYTGKRKMMGDDGHDTEN